MRLSIPSVRTMQMLMKASSQLKIVFGARRWFRHPTTEDEEEDENYYTDEDGVEWWKDDDGYWWYREPGEEDWQSRLSPNIEF